jgi:hypothetical protein
MQNEITNETVTIASGATGLSGAAAIKYRDLVGLVTPAVWVAAGIGFAASYDNGTTYVYVRRPEVGTTTAPVPVKVLELLAADIPTGESIFIPLNPAWFAGATHVKVRSQTTNVAVDQTATRTLTLVLRE